MPERLTELRETLTYVYQLIKNIDDQQDEELHRVRDPRGVGHVTLPVWMLFASLEALLTPYFWEIFGGMIDHELHFQPLSLLKRMGRGKNSKLLIMAWPFR